MVNQGGGLQFNEGWILHSHAYVHGVARLEAGYTLNLKTMNDGKAVQRRGDRRPSRNQWRRTASSAAPIKPPDDGSSRDHRSAHAVRRHGPHHLQRPRDHQAGWPRLRAAVTRMVVDFAQEVDAQIRVPEKMAVGSMGEARIVVENPVPMRCNSSSRFPPAA